MQPLKPIALCLALCLATGLLLGPTQAQTSSPAEIRGTGELIKTLQDQQKLIIDNQAKIDGKLASIAENVRLARLFQSRAK